jgi:hypothetical protein
VALDPARLRDAYDRQLRAYLPPRLPDGMAVDHDGPLLRITDPTDRGFLLYVDLGGLTGAALDELIARQCAVFTARRQAVEWKWHSHDLPADLTGRLVAHGFTAEPAETVVIGLAGPLADDRPDLPTGVRLREVTARHDLERIAAMETQVWGADRSDQADALAREIAADPGTITVVVAEAGAADPDPGTVICAGWIRYVPGTGFATLWGGSTLLKWRRRGVYRALVAYRAALAVDRGYAYLQVDASDDSRPILQRLGLVPVATTVPYVFDPAT